MSWKRNVWLLYWVAFFQSLIPAYVIERLYWAGRGVGIGGVVMCEVVFAVAIVALELPSGVLADSWGRRPMLVIGALGTVAEFALLYFAGDVWVFVLATVMTGVGHAAQSGAENALLYDTLAACGEEARFERVMGRMRALAEGAAMVAALSGSVLAEVYGFSLNYAVSVGAALLAFGGALLLREPPRGTGGGDGARVPVRQVLRGAVGFFREWPDALAVVVQAMGVAAIVIYVDEFWQVYLDGLGMPVALFGAVVAGLSVCRMVAGPAGAWVAGKGRTMTALMLLTGATGAALLGMGLWPSVAMGLAAMALTSFVAGMMDILSAGYLHRRADSDARATTESAASLLHRGMAIGLGVVFARVAEGASLASGYVVLGWVCLGLGVVMGVGWKVFGRK